MEVELSVAGALEGEPRLGLSSGHAVLDEEALRMVREAAPFPPLPEGCAAGSAHFEIPVHFEVRAGDSGQ